MIDLELMNIACNNFEGILPEVFHPEVIGELNTYPIHALECEIPLNHLSESVDRPVKHFYGLEGKNLLSETEKVDKNEVKFVTLQICKTTNQNLLAGNRSNYTLLFEPNDQTGSAIISADRSTYPPTRVVTGTFSHPSWERRALCVNYPSPAGSLQDAVEGTWHINNETFRGIECKALYKNNVVFVDLVGRRINYRDNTMLVPYRRYS